MIYSTTYLIIMSGTLPSELIQKIAPDSVIDSAYEWLCKRRRDYSHNDEVWDIRFRWSEVKQQLQKRLLALLVQVTPQADLPPVRLVA